MARWDVLALGLTAVVGLGGLYRYDRERYRRRRAELFADCLPLFERYRVIQEGVGFPVLEGNFQGFAVRLEPVLDTIAMRKLPSLWLLATVLAPLPYGGVLDILMRPQNIEFYSPSERLDHSLKTPPGWPTHAAIRSDDPEHMPPYERLEPHLRLFDDPRVKELLITPRGVRIVYQVWQGERAYYLVLRQAEFHASRIEPDIVRGLLEQAIAIHRSLAHAPA